MVRHRLTYKAKVAQYRLGHGLVDSVLAELLREVGHGGSDRFGSGSRRPGCRSWVEAGAGAGKRVVEWRIDNRWSPADERMGGWMGGWMDARAGRCKWECQQVGTCRWPATFESRPVCKQLTNRLL